MEDSNTVNSTSYSSRKRPPRNQHGTQSGTRGRLLVVISSMNSTQSLQKDCRVLQEPETTKAVEQLSGVIKRNRREEHVPDCGFVARVSVLYTSVEMVCHNQKHTESVFTGLCLLQPHTKRKSMALTG